MQPSATLVLDTNIELDSVGDELSSLSSDKANKPTDLSSHISVNSDRVTLAQNTATKDTSTGRVELFFSGTYRKNLASDQTTILLIASGYGLIPSNSVAGVAVSNGVAKSCIIDTSGLVNLEHGGASIGQAFSIFAAYYA